MRASLRRFRLEKRVKFVRLMVPVYCLRRRAIRLILWRAPLGRSMFGPLVILILVPQTVSHTPLLARTPNRRLKFRTLPIFLGRSSPGRSRTFHLASLSSHVPLLLKRVFTLLLVLSRVEFIMVVREFRRPLTFLKIMSFGKSVVRLNRLALLKWLFPTL